MGRLNVIPSSIQRLSAILIGCISYAMILTWVSHSPLPNTNCLTDNSCCGSYITFNISGYLLAAARSGPTLAIVQWAAVSTQRSDIRAAPHLKYSPSPVTKMFVIQGQLPGFASCPPVILLSFPCSAHSGLTPHDSEKKGKIVQVNYQNGKVCFIITWYQFC